MSHCAVTSDLRRFERSMNAAFAAESDAVFFMERNQDALVARLLALPRWVEDALYQYPREVAAAAAMAIAGDHAACGHRIAQLTRAAAVEAAEELIRDHCDRITDRMDLVLGSANDISLSVWGGA